MSQIFKHISKLLLVSFFFIGTSHLQAQEKPKPSKDEISIPVYIHGLKNKSDVEKVQTLLEKQNWLIFVQVEDWPQQHTHLIIKKNITPDMLNEVLKTEGFYVINTSFLDNRDTERSLVESHKQNNFKAEEIVK